MTRDELREVDVSKLADDYEATRRVVEVLGQCRHLGPVDTAQFVLKVIDEHLAAEATPPVETAACSRCPHPSHKDFVCSYLVIPGDASVRCDCDDTGRTKVCPHRRQPGAFCQECPGGTATLYSKEDW